MIDKSKIQMLHADLKATLDAFAKKHNLSVSPFNMTYSSTGFKFAVQMGDKSELGDADPVLANNTRRYGFWYGLSADMIGKEFTLVGKKVKFLGMKNKTRVIYAHDGKRYWIDGNRFAEAVGTKAVDPNRGKPLPDFGANV